MATFTITTPTYISTLTWKTGWDSYNINGWSLIIDCDSRFAPNATASTWPIGNLTVSASLWWNFTVTTEFTKLLNFNTWVWVLPAMGTVVTQWSATGVILVVMTNRVWWTQYVWWNTIPTTGSIKIRVTNWTFTTWAIVLWTATCNITSIEQWWIEVVWQDALAHSHSRLGTMQMRWDWFQVWTTNWTVWQTIQLPYFTAESLMAYPWVDIETAPWSWVYQFFPNAGNRFTSTNCSTDTRSSFCYISETWLLQIWLGTDSSAAWYTPASGCKVRIPSIILQCCTLADRTVNVRPNSTMWTRYESTFTNAGLLNVSKVTWAWYWNVVQAYSVYIRDFHVCDNILLWECATAMDIDNLHQWLSVNPTIFNSNGIVIQQSYNGWTIWTMSWLRAESAATSSYAAIIVNCYGGWTIWKLRGGSAWASAALSWSVYLNTNWPMTIGEIYTFTKRILIQAADNMKISKIVYADNCIWTTQTSIQSRAVETVGQCKVIDIENIQNWPWVANCHPYLALMFSNTTQKATLRNCGTAAAPFNAWTVNIMGYIWDDGGNNDIIKIQRNWTTALRLWLHGGTNTTKRLTSVNNYQVDASKTIGPQQLDSVVHWNRFNSGWVPQSYSAVYGNCFWDWFTGDTTTRAALILVEKSAANSLAYQITAGTPKFTGAGSIIMANLWDQIEYTWIWRILWWNWLVSMAVQGTNTANHLFEYSLDKDGTWYWAYKTLSNANLAAETGISPTVWFGVKLRITCTVANSWNKLDSLRFDGTTTLALQNVALYPLDLATLTLNWLQANSSVAVFVWTPTPGQEPVWYATWTWTSTVLSYPYDNLVTSYTLRIRKAWFDPIELVYTNAIETTIPVAQQANKDGFWVSIYGRGQWLTTSYITVDSPNLRIDIWNTRTSAEDVYDVIAAYQATFTGIKYPEAVRFDWRDLLVLGSWRFRRLNASAINSWIDALPIIDGFPTLSPDDEVNWSVDFRARDVRTYNTTWGAVITPQDIAQAVRSELAVELARLDVNVSTRALETTAKLAVALSA
jgi:hypothetical protein